MQLKTLEKVKVLAVGSDIIKSKTKDNNSVDIIWNWVSLLVNGDVMKFTISKKSCLSVDNVRDYQGLDVDVVFDLNIVYGKLKLSLIDLK